MDLFVSPRANTAQTVLSPKAASKSCIPPRPQQSHNLAYKHVGNDIYPVMIPKRHHLNYYTEDVKVYYKRKVKHFDQKASTHILPGGEFIKNSGSS